ncbi:hypothetical protein HDV62DRAFT_210272 [Trichoderma sp. SZMC 28011]
MGKKKKKEKISLFFFIPASSFFFSSFLFMSIDHGGQCAETSKLLFLSAPYLYLSPSLLNGGEETRGKEGEGEKPWPFAWFETGGSFVESKPLACLLSFWFRFYFCEGERKSLLILISIFFFYIRSHIRSFLSGFSFSFFSRGISKYDLRERKKKRGWRGGILMIS